MKILRMCDVSDEINLSRSTIYAKIKDGSFPKPIQLSKRAIGWKKSTVESWLAEQENSSHEQGGDHE